MARVSLCNECRGLGAHGYERGPVVEPCRACNGVGLRFADQATAASDLRDVLVNVTARTELLEASGEGVVLRATGVVLAGLEQRIAALERELDSR
jgi:hypothetical protein